MSDVQKVIERMVTMPNGSYCVSFSRLNGVLNIKRENPDTGAWRVVWSASMRKEMGKRLHTVAVLAGAVNGHFKLSVDNRPDH